MKVAILAGGVGTRLVEETQEKPKPMVQIGNQPILWHIMKHYAHYGHKDFYIALGYKGEIIKRYMVDYCSLSSDLTVDLGTGQVRSHKNDHARQDWTVHLIDTGDATLDRRANKASRAVYRQRDIHAHLGRRRIQR